jgi:large subunit ribosomal protein L15
MDLSNLKPRTKRTTSRRVGRGGKRGTTSGAGTKGQKSRSGKGIKAGFRGGDNRIWQLFPKQRGASSKPGSKRPHRKHRYARFPAGKPQAINLSDLKGYQEGETVSPETLIEKGLLRIGTSAKILGSGTLSKKLTFSDVLVSESAKQAIERAGGTIQ